LGAHLGELLDRLDALGGRRDAEARAEAGDARTIAAQSSFSARSRTKERSILILSNGKLRR